MNLTKSAWVHRLALGFLSFIFALHAQAACTFFDAFQDNKDGTVTDPRNGLIWKRCAEGFDWNGSACVGSTKEVSWFDAMKIAKQSRFQNQSDWRIPAKFEMEQVVGKTSGCSTNNYKKGEYAASSMIAHTMRGDNSPGAFWSSSPDVGSPGYAWGVGFGNGSVDGGDFRYDSNYVRLVRAGQSLGGHAALEFQREYALHIDQRKIDDIINRGSGGKVSDETVQLELNKNNRVGLQCEASSDGTFTGMDGTVWQACLYGQTWQNGQCVGSPKALNWYEAMEAAKNSGFAGKTDWILPSSVFLNNSIHPQSCNHPNVRTYVREYRHGPKSLEVVDNFWTANTGATNGGGTVQITDSSYSGGYGSLHYDTMKSASHFDKSFTKPVYAVFVRNAPGSDGEKFARAQPLVQCNSACLANRKAAQQERDGASAQRGHEFNAKVRDFFSSGSPSGPNSVSSSGSTKAAGVASIRSETFDNAGRKTEGYWVKCSGGRETRVYRSAWDKSPDWFSPNGLGTTNFLAKSSASINDVAQSICK